jgi:hypothetical protein
MKKDRKLSAEDAAVLGIPPQHRYESVINRIVAGDGAWIQVELGELQGSNIPAKHSAILQAARSRSVRISCTFRCAGVCYARLLRDTDVVIHGAI